MQLWNHQQRLIDGVLDAHGRGVRRVCAVQPTGGGKTVAAKALIRRYLDAGQGAIFYTNRKALLDQTSGVFHDIPHGIRAAGRDTNLSLPFQISSFMTENNRVLKAGGKWQLHKAGLVVCDEAHVNAGDVARRILSRHWLDEAMVLGLTATPLDLGDLYEELLVCGSLSELRRCGALVLARHYGCDEPDMREYKLMNKNPDKLTEKQIVKAMMTEGLFGRVLTHYRRLNPDRRPTVLFGPGVEESLGFAQEFHRNGIPAAHIDGEDIWVDGELFRNKKGLRDEIFADVRSGRIKVLCNRFVLREGIDLPMLSHAILATIFDSVQSYIQSVGRILRSHPGKDFATIQDHGGNWWRHGSANGEREWVLGQKAEWMTELRNEKIRQGKEREPWSCPQCAKVMAGPRCECGYVAEHKKFPRRVVQSDGTMVEHVEAMFAPKKTCWKDDTFEKWKDCFHRCKNSGRNFNQAVGLFIQENYYRPPRTLKLMPKDDYSWFLKIKDVPWEMLR